MKQRDIMHPGSAVPHCVHDPATANSRVCSQVYGLPPERVFVSVYKDDDDAYALWRDEMGVPESHIHRLGAEDNFWESGPTGALCLGSAGHHRRTWQIASPTKQCCCTKRMRMRPIMTTRISCM